MRWRLGMGSAARLVERNADSLLLRSERATLTRWLAALPAEVVEARPRILLARALSRLVGGRADEADRLLDEAERALAGAADDEPFEPSAGRAGSLLANVPATIALERAFLAELRGDAARQLAFARQGLAEAGPGDDTLTAILGSHRGVAEWLGGRLPAAARSLTSSIGQLRALGEHFLAVRTCEHLAQVQRAQADLEAVLGTYRQALDIAAPPGQPPLPAAGFAHVGMAEVAYQRNELDTALRYLAEGIAPCRQLAHTQPLATGLATLAWIRQAKGDQAGALAAMHEAEQVNASGGVASLLNPVPAQRARLLLAHGDVAAATRWVEQRGLSVDDEPSYPHEPEHLVLARVLLAQDRPGAALAVAERWLAAAAAAGRTASIIQLHALQALALAGSGDQDGALRILAKALALACPQGYVRVFADEGPPMSALLSRLAAAHQGGQAEASGVPPDYLARVLRAFEHKSAADAGAGISPAAPGLAEPLTTRELEVLRLIAAGNSNQHIARELVVTLDTVKKHVSHVLAKLDAANRTEAVARARERDLIP